MSARGRVWGAGAEKPNREGMDSGALLAYQEEQIQRQDDQILQIEEDVKRVKNVALAFDPVLQEQSRLLDDLEQGVDKNNAQLNGAIGKTRRVEQQAKKQTGLIWTAGGLFVVIFILFILMFI